MGDAAPEGMRTPTLALALLLAGCSRAVVSDLPDGKTNPTPEPTSQNATVTYYRDVKPIMQRECEVCHKSAGAAFKLDDYDSAKAYSTILNAAVQARTMPPWPPNPDCQSFAGQRVLSAAEKQTIQSWLDQGAVPGNPADAPADLPSNPRTLGVPDRELDAGADYTFDPNANQDLYWCFRLNPGITAPTDFVAADIIPGNKEIVHHVIVFREANGQANPTGLPGFQCDGAPGEFLFAWVPGSEALTFPPGIGMQLQPNDRLLMQMHYARVPNAASQVDRTKAVLYFAKEPVTERAKVSWLGTPAINVPPNSEAEAAGSCTVPNGDPVKVLLVAPHMHKLATKFNATITRAAGGEECMIDIPRWDFGWQGGYSYAQPLMLQPGDQITSTCTYRNDTANQVGFGEGTGDEMCFNFVYTTSPTFPRYCFPGGGLFEIFANGGLSP